MQKIKNILKTLVLLKNLFSLLMIVLYFVYIYYNMTVNKGNMGVNIALLVVTSIYFIAFIITTFILKNKKAKKTSAKTFKRAKKFFGLVNAVLILVSIGTNTTNNGLTILLAVLSIVGTFTYFIFDLLTTIFVHKIKGRRKDKKKNAEIDEDDIDLIEIEE